VGGYVIRYVVLTLERLGLITRTPRTARSIMLCIPVEQIPPTPLNCN